MHECPPLAQKCLCVQLLACVKCEAPDHKQAQNTTGSCLMFLLDRIVSTLSLSCRSRIGVLKYNILEHVYGAFEHHPAEMLLTLKAFLKICAESRFPPDDSNNRAACTDHVRSRLSLADNLTNKRVTAQHTHTCTPTSVKDSTAQATQVLTVRQIVHRAHTHTHTTRAERCTSATSAPPAVSDRQMNALRARARLTERARVGC